jgi:hypothetical protein
VTDRQIPFLPFSYPYALLATSCWGTRCSLCSSLSLSSPWRPTPPVRQPAAPSNPPHRHLLMRRWAWILGVPAAEAGHGWGVGTLGEEGARPLLQSQAGFTLPVVTGPVTAVTGLTGYGTGRLPTGEFKFFLIWIQKIEKCGKKP